MKIKNISNSSKKVDMKIIGFLSVLFVIAVLFWNTVYLYPVKIFVVILHEFSHGLAAVLTGGHIDKIEINSAIGGACWTSGGNRALILSAGYLGSMLWGGTILIIASRTKYDNVLGIGIGCFLIILSLFFIRNLFGFIFAVGFGLLLIILCRKAHNSIADFLMKFIGMTSSLYAIIDIKSDLIDQTVNGEGLYAGIKSDAFALAEQIGFPQLSNIVGIIWMLISIMVFFQIIKIASKGETQTS